MTSTKLKVSVKEVKESKDVVRRNPSRSTRNSKPNYVSDRGHTYEADLAPKHEWIAMLKEITGPFANRPLIYLFQILAKPDVGEYVCGLKIGYSKNFSRRPSGLNAEYFCRGQMKMIGVIECKDNIEKESELKSTLDGHRLEITVKMKRKKELFALHKEVYDSFFATAGKKLFQREYKQLDEERYIMLKRVTTVVEEDPSSDEDNNDSPWEEEN